MKYKVGDRVILKKINLHYDKALLRKESKGTVIASYMRGNETNHFCVEFDEYIGGHDGNGVYGAIGKKGHCWWFYDGDNCAFEIITKPQEFPKIVITTDGTETLARLYEGGKVVKSATAKCSPEDSFDAYIGAKIAFDRLLERPLAEEPKEQMWRVVKRRARKGDYIRLVKEVYSFNKVGDILKVSKEENGGVFVKQKDHPKRKENCKESPDYIWCYLPSQFEVIEPVGTPEEPKFFSGKVVCVEAGEQYAYTVGKIYEFKDGIVINDNGLKSSTCAVKSLGEWHRHCSYAQFIPLVESEGTK